MGKTASSGPGLREPRHQAKRQDLSCARGPGPFAPRLRLFTGESWKASAPNSNKLEGFHSTAQTGPVRRRQ